MKKLTTLTTILLASLAVSAEPYKADDGLKKIDGNVGITAENKAEVSKNIELAKKQLTDLTKTKENIKKQKDSVSQEIVKNNDALKKVLVSEKEIQQLMTTEKTKLEKENIQIKDLDAMIAKVKANQARRQTIIADYQEQLNLVTGEKKTWKTRESELRVQEGETIKSLKELSTEEKSWQSKRAAYEAELKKWTAENEKQQKVSDTYQGLKSNK